MAIYHCSIKIGSRTKGQSAVAASAYRSGEKLTDKETGLISDYTRKSGIVFSEIALCKNAPSEYSNRETLWNAVHSIEKNKNAQLWREFEVALPKELSRSEQIATVREFVSKLTEQGMCIDWALHDKEDGNPHAHIMATMRSIEPNGKWSPKSHKVYDLDEKGERIFQKVDKTGRKQYKNHKEDYNNWNAKERVEEWRSAWADCCNARLAERERIDHRSFDRQGINQIPTVHEGFVARKLVKDGKPSDRVQLNNDIRQKNEKLLRVAAALKSVDEEISRLSILNEASKVHNEVITADNMPVSKPNERTTYIMLVTDKELDLLVKAKAPIEVNYNRRSEDGKIPIRMEKANKSLIEKMLEIEKSRKNLEMYSKLHSCACIIYGGRETSASNYDIARQVIEMHKEVTKDNYKLMPQAIKAEQQRIMAMVHKVREKYKNYEPVWAKNQTEIQSKSEPKPAKKMLSEEEIQRISDLKDQYIYQYCVNEYLKKLPDVSYKAKSEYDNANVMLGVYRASIEKYSEIEAQTRKTINPIKKSAKKKELAEQGNKACKDADTICKCFDISLVYNGRKLSTSNVTSEHLYAIYENAQSLLPLKKEAMEAEKRRNESYERLKLSPISDESVKVVYQKFVSALDTVPDEQAERVIKAVKEPTERFSFGLCRNHPEYQIKALKNVERALSKLYEAVKRVKAVLDKPLFNKAKVMSDEFKPRSERENDNYHSYGGRSR